MTEVTDLRKVDMKWQTTAEEEPEPETHPDDTPPPPDAPEVTHLDLVQMKKDVDWIKEKLEALSTPVSMPPVPQAMPSMAPSDMLGGLMNNPLLGMLAQMFGGGSGGPSAEAMEAYRLETEMLNVMRRSMILDLRKRLGYGSSHMVFGKEG